MSDWKLNHNEDIIKGCKQDIDVQYRVTYH